MTTTSRLEYERLMPPEYKVPGWTRCRFSHKPDLFGPDDPGGDEEAQAHEMLVVLAARYRPGVRFRLVRVTEEVFDEPEREVVSPEGG